MAKTIREFYGIGSSLEPTKQFIAGTELEIESVNSSGNPGWSKVPDGSLRNEGVEFVSPPLPSSALIDGFKKIHATFVPYSEWPKFSERTSIHVHINCLDLSLAQTRQIILWYALFEPVFFAMVASNRKHNIHCVPLDQTHLSGVYKKGLMDMVEKWSKYTALNLCPLSTQGTIEFRHMEGHDNAEKFEWWLKTIENLWHYGQDAPLTRQVLSNPDMVLTAFDVIFKDAPVKNIRSSVLALCSDSLIDVKMAMA